MVDKRLTVQITKLFTLTMEELWRFAKMTTDFILPMSDYLRKVFTELSNSSAAELLSQSKNHRFLAQFLEARCNSCV